MQAVTAVPAATGEALEPRLYLDPELLEAEQERIFERTWQLIGPRVGAAAPGQLHDGRSPAPSRCWWCATSRATCRPTATCAATAASCLLTGSGQCKGAIRCRYHGWTYRFDGSLIGVPEALQFGERLDKSALGLHARPGRGAVRPGVRQPRPRRRAAGRARRAISRARLARYRIPTLESFAPARAASRPTGRWWPRTTSRATTSRSPIPGLMRMLDYKHYDTELHEHYAWIEAPFRAEADAATAWSALYSQLVTPMPGLGEEDRRTWRYVFIYPNTTIDLYPDQVNTWQILPDGVGRTPTSSACYRSRAQRPAHARRPVAQPAAEHARAARGHRPGRERPAWPAHARLPVRSAVAPRVRGGLVRGPDPRATSPEPAG